ncbi:Fic family protein [Vibrio aestuarianus]|uniref:Fic family protein n=1 Tax=Vibrio aestuarianus TaxID=28171 RepID=UPI00237C6410|nr:Fic family protein [Vibrio aestuarianus]MDE1237346.1 Fic family protein [Vibrio aestuarianus]
MGQNTPITSSVSPISFTKSRSGDKPNSFPAVAVRNTSTKMKTMGNVEQAHNFLRRNHKCSDVVLSIKRKMYQVTDNEVKRVNPSQGLAHLGEGAKKIFNGDAPNKSYATSLTKTLHSAQEERRLRIESLVQGTIQSSDANALRELTSSNVVDASVRNNLILDFEGKPKSRIDFSDHTRELINCQRKLGSDLKRLQSVNHRMSVQLNQPMVLPRDNFSGEPTRDAADWISQKSRSNKTTNEFQLQVSRVQSALLKYKDADLLNIQTICDIRDAVYAPTQGDSPRNFRSSNDPVFMGSDIGRAGFEKALHEIRDKGLTGPELADTLFLAVISYHPFGDGNGRTARTLYALASLQNGEKNFAALSKEGENLLNPH